MSAETTSASNEPERHARAMTGAWKAAREIVAKVYPESTYQFSEAGPYIEIKLNATTGLVFGIAIEVIGASICDIIGSEWEPTGDALDTPLSSDSEDGEAIAAAILKATLEYHHEIREGFDNSFEQAREFDHATCAPDAHDRSLPDPLEDQAVADDGLLACNDCGRPAFYCSADERYHHVDDSACCFLIRGSHPTS